MLTWHVSSDQTPLCFPSARGGGEHKSQVECAHQHCLSACLESQHRTEQAHIARTHAYIA